MPPRRIPPTGWVPHPRRMRRMHLYHQLRVAVSHLPHGPQRDAAITHLLMNPEKLKPTMQVKLILMKRKGARR